MDGGEEGKDWEQGDGLGCVAKPWRHGVRRARVEALEMELGARHT